MVKVRKFSNFEGVFEVLFDYDQRKICSKNLTPGLSLYGEKLIRFENEEYRLWDPFRSKLAATILKGLKKFPLKINQKVLYLGAASGTTASHISDIVESKGHIYCIEFATRPLKDLINKICSYRKNISPFLADARFPEQYLNFFGKVDGIYCDIAQPNQANILVNNASYFLKDYGWILLAVKAHSIDVAEIPSKIFNREINILKQENFKILQVLDLEPYDKAHIMVFGIK